MASMMRVTSGGLMRSASEGSLGAGCRGLGGQTLAAELDGTLDAVAQVLVADRQLQQVDGAGPDDLTQPRLGPAVERQQQAHRRELVVDDLQAGQSGARAEAGAG